MRRSGDHWWFLAAFWKGQREIWAYPFSRDHLEGYALLFGVTLVPLIWLGLFTVAGLAIVVARRFDIGFQWFNRKFDIEHKPLQSIGLVAGALVAMAYWSAVIVSHVWK
jgi:hypothetical protein